VNELRFFIHNISKTSVRQWEKEMLRISVETNLKPENVIQQAINLFTKDYGLKVKEECPDSVELEGSGGGVSIGAKAGDKKTEVEIVTTEFEEQVKEFTNYLKKK
jgi:hypothetical protein